MPINYPTSITPVLLLSLSLAHLTETRDLQRRKEGTTEARQAIGSACEHLSTAYWYNNHPITHTAAC